MSEMQTYEELKAQGLNNIYEALMMIAQHNDTVIGSMANINTYSKIKELIDALILLEGANITHQIPHKR